MKADPSIQRELLDLQEIDTRLTHLRRQLGQLPQLKEIDALQREMEAVRRRLGERTGVVEDAQVELARIESDVAVVQARMDRDRSRIEAGGSSKDVQALERELESLLRRRDALEEAQLEVMQRLEEAQAAQAEVGVERDGLAERITRLEAERDAAAAELRVQAEQAQKDRDALAPRFPADLIALYEKQRARYGVGAAMLHRGISLGSNITLNQSDLNDLRKLAPDDVVLDPESSAILVRTDESGL
jgi:predicted  nucleic acid-binding Zn-ribbon protein